MTARTLMGLLVIAGCSRPSGPSAAPETIPFDGPVFVYRPGMTAREVLEASPRDCTESHPKVGTTIITCGPFFPGAYMPRSCEGDCGEAVMTIEIAPEPGDRR